MTTRHSLHDQFDLAGNSLEKISLNGQWHRVCNSRIMASRGHDHPSRRTLLA